MGQKEQHELDKWRGSLQSVWEEDTTTPSSMDWETMRAHLHSIERRKRVFWLRISWGIVLTIALWLVWHQMGSDAILADAEVNSDQKEIPTNAEEIPLSEVFRDSLNERGSTIDVAGNGKATLKNQGDVLFTKENHANSHLGSSYFRNGVGCVVENHFQNGYEMGDDRKEKFKENSQGIRESKEQDRAADWKQEQVTRTNGIMDDYLESSRFGMSENDPKDSILWMYSKPLFPLAIYRGYTISFLPIKQIKKRPQFSLQMGITAGRSIRIIRGNFDEGLQSRSIAVRRFLLPMRALHGSLNWHLNDQWSIQGGGRIGGGRIQTRWIFKSFPAEEASQELRLQSSEGDVLVQDPTLISQINNGAGGLYQLRLNYDYKIWNLPVGLSYRLNKKPFSPVIRTGLNVEWIGKRSLSIDISENGEIRNIPVLIAQNKARRSVQQYFAFGFAWRLSERLDLYADASYYKPWTNMINATGYKVRSSALNLQWGLQYLLH